MRPFEMTREMRYARSTPEKVIAPVADSRDPVTLTVAVGIRITPDTSEPVSAAVGATASLTASAKYLSRHRSSSTRFRGGRRLQGSQGPRMPPTPPPLLHAADPCDSRAPL